jgi:hypothetical protein
MHILTAVFLEKKELNAKNGTANIISDIKTNATQKV